MGNLNKIVVASDSFKGSATSAQIAEAVAEGVCGVMSHCQVVKVPVGDGGEGTVEALVAATGGRLVECRVQGPLGGEIDAVYGSLPGGTAVIELASAAGLALLSPEERDPLHTTTYGVGQLISDALTRGCRDILLCIGGSATNDGGTGILSALGYIFRDSTGNAVEPCGASLGYIHSIDTSGAMKELEECTFTVACDVDNPFFGSEGAARIFAAQKGADAAAVELLDSGLQHFAQVLFKETGIDVATIPGAGAAGGVGGGLAAMLGACLRPGIEMVLDTIGFDRILDNADLVITGEGSLDAQTVMGKTPCGVMRRARRKGIPAIAIGGSISDTSALNEAGFTAIFSLLPSPASLAEAMRKEFTLDNVRRTAEQLMRTISAFCNRCDGDAPRKP